MLANERDASYQDRGEWYVRCCTVLDSSVWISGVLNDVFVFSLSGSVGLPVYPQWSHSLQSARVLDIWFAVLVPLVGASCPKYFSKVPTPSLLQFIFENPVSVLREPYSVNWYKFLTRPFSSLLNGMLHHRYFVTALKLLFKVISSAYIYKHRKQN